MSRYIDADKLCKDRVENDPVVIAAKCEPTADVEPVRHGHWKHEITEIGIPKLHYIVCSKCLKGYNHVDVFWLHGGTGESFNYCPQCGAKMDGKEQKQ